MDILKSQEHSPTNGAEFGEELKEIELGQVLAKHGRSIKEWSPDADPRLHTIGAVIRPPPEPDPNLGEEPRGQPMTEQPRAKAGLILSKAGFLDRFVARQRVTNMGYLETEFGLTSNMKVVAHGVY